MTYWKYKIVPILFAIGGLGWLVRPLKQFIKEEPINGANVIFAGMFFTFAIVTGIAAGRKSRGDAGPGAAAQGGDRQ